jgi:hypothetical protein
MLLFWKVLANLKSLSFSSYRRLKVFDSLIHSLIRPMTRLEELSLRLFAIDGSTVIDSIYLNREVLPYLPHLRRFNVDIVSYAPSLSEVLEQNNEEIQHLSYNGKSHPLLYYTAQQQYQAVRSHAFSLPFVFDSIYLISSRIPGGLFTNVRCVSFSDLYGPFEHEFLVQIAISFPRLTHLTVVDFRLQEEKRIREANTTGSTASAAKFKYLTDLLLIGKYGGYAEQFLVETSTLLPRLTNLTIDYEALFTVTETFTWDATRRNCINIEHIDLSRAFVYSEEMCLYFPRSR